MSKFRIICQAEENPFNTTKLFPSVLEARRHFRDVADSIPADSTISGLEMKIGEISARIVELLPIT